ncbi:MAG: hypothetical protein LBR95_02180 [Azoarcus sp.]|jgi:Mor family transcriptional regulator|nr:hypothetical protein [Azoarcus sp.]
MTPDDIKTLPQMIETALVAPEIGLPPTMATLLADAICRIAALRIGSGCNYYLPIALTRAERDAAIRRDYNGHNVAALRHRYGISARQIYRILRR